MSIGPLPPPTRWCCPRGCRFVPLQSTVLNDDSGIATCRRCGETWNYRDERNGQLALEVTS